MKKLWVPALALLVGLSGLTVLASPASADSGSDEMAFVQKLNELRSSRGLPALAVKGELFDMARAWSGRMATAGVISHNPDLAAQGPSNWMRLGENVGMGPGVQTLHDAFVASPLHFRNMIDPDFDLVGVGVVHGLAGITFVTVNFMKAQPAPAQIVQAQAPAQASPAPARTSKVRVCTKSRRGRVTCRMVTPRRSSGRR